MALGDGIRRNVATITQSERDRLRDAFIALSNRQYPGSKNDPPPVGGVSYWYKQDEIHQATHVHSFPPYRGIAFLTWHREICNRLEALLRKVDPQLSLHYWDWTTDPKPGLFTNIFMGSANGRADTPFGGLDNNSVFAGSRDQTGNPSDPPQELSRAVQPGSPGVPADNAITTTGDAAPDQDQFDLFRAALERAHNTAHGYIGGTIGNPHTSFRDPFVFLLHSNVDRLFAEWQLAAGRSWRLDPGRVFGTESNSDILPSPPAPPYDPGIVTPLEPWAGNPNNIPGVRRTRPWAPPENQQLLKTSKDPSVVAPPRYDTSPNQEMQLVGLTDVGGMWHTIRHDDTSWQPSFGDVKGQESNDPGHFSAVSCARAYSDLHVVALTDAGGIWHTIRHGGAAGWQPSFGDVKGQESNDPGYFSAVACTGVNGEVHVVALTDSGGMWHTIRHGDAAGWQPFFGDVKGVESNDPGHFSAVASGAVGGFTSGGQELHVVGLTDDGRMWHTIRRADGSWQPFFGDVKGVESNDPGRFSAVSCAGVGGQLHVVALTDDGRMWHTIRLSDEAWQPSFGDVKGVESNDPGHFSAVACGAVNGALQVVALTDDGRMWHTIRNPDGSWQPFFGDVKGVESNDPGYFSAVACAGVG